jgi:hypothetical protein
MVKNSELRVKLANEARQLIESEFDIHKNTASLRQLFENSSKLIEQQNIKYLRRVS